MTTAVGRPGGDQEEPGDDPEGDAEGSPRARRFRFSSMELLCVLLVLAAVLQNWLGQLLDVPALRTGSTVFVAVCVQALPFLVLGVLISGAIAAFVSAPLLARVLPRRPAVAVGVAGLAGVALPGCECASVPVARRLMQQGVPQSVALAFLLSAPAVNPVVLVATAVAFPTAPLMVLARFGGSLATSLVTVPARGDGISPRGPSTLPSGPTTPIMSGVAMATSKSNQPPLIFSASSLPPT